MNMKSIYASILACTLVSGCMIGPGKLSPIQDNGPGHFPTLQGIDLTGTTREIPKTFAGDLNIVAIGFEREHQTPINTWLPEIEKITKENNRIAFYEIPLIYKTNAMYRTWINNGMRSGIPSEKARRHTITVYTDRDAFTKITGMEIDTIHIIILDREGKIVWQKSGPASTEKLILLKKFLSEKMETSNG